MPKTQKLGESGMCRLAARCLPLGSSLQKPINHIKPMSFLVVVHRPLGGFWKNSKNMKFKQRQRIIICNHAIQHAFNLKHKINEAQLL